MSTKKKKCWTRTTWIQYCCNIHKLNKQTTHSLTQDVYKTCQTVTIWWIQMDYQFFWPRLLIVLTTSMKHCCKPLIWTPNPGILFFPPLPFVLVHKEAKTGDKSYKLVWLRSLSDCAVKLSDLCVCSPSGSRRVTSVHAGEGSQTQERSHEILAWTNVGCPLVFPVT